MIYLNPLLCLSISELKTALDWFHLMACDVSSALPSSCCWGFDDESRWRRLFSSLWGWRWMDNNHSSNGMTDAFPAHTAQPKCLVWQSIFMCALFAGTHIYWKRDWTNWQSFSHLNCNCCVEMVKGIFFLVPCRSKRLRPTFPTHCFNLAPAAETLSQRGLNMRASFICFQTPSALWDPLRVENGEPLTWGTKEVTIPLMWDRV